MVRNARNKINRIEKKFGKENLEKSGISLPKEMPTPKIEEFTSREEFNAWKEKQEDFTNRYNIDYQYKQNQHGVVMSRRKEREIEHRVKVSQRKARDEIKRLSEKPFHVRGEEHGTVGERAQHMQDGALLGIREPNDFNFEEVRHVSRLDTILENMDKRMKDDFYDDRMIQLQKNFVDALSGSFNGEEGELVDLIESLKPDEFYDIWLGETDMEFAIYDSDGQDVSANSNHIERIEGYIVDYLTGKTNKDLKDF